MNTELAYDAASKQAKSSDPEIYVDRLSVSRARHPFPCCIAQLVEARRGFFTGPGISVKCLRGKSSAAGANTWFTGNGISAHVLGKCLPIGIVVLLSRSVLECKRTLTRQP